MKIEPVKELEVDLREIGCPYPPLDPRTDAFLLGYKAGLDSGKQIALQAMSDAAAEARR